MPLTGPTRPSNNDHTEIEEELHDRAHIDYDRVAIVSLDCLNSFSYRLLTMPSRSPTPL